MPLSWNEIKSRALAFSKEWENENSEDAEAKSFWDDFFNVFGISRRRVATFEQQVKKVDDKAGFIDLLWKGTILVEHKSRGKSLDKAYQQAKDYFPGLKEAELPRYILVSDFENFRLYDLDTKEQHDFTLNKLADHVHLFGFIAGYQKRSYKDQDPVNVAAAELMGRLHDKLKNIGYEGHHLELYLVRLVFMLFADDTNIWEKGIFYDYLDLHTREDGSDLAAHISQLFEVLNTPKDKRLRNLDESLAAFPYINGKLFEEHLPTAAFDSSMRKALMDCCGLDWGTISPAIFGSLFQSVMDEKARRNLGAHYTSEKNILKLIKPLFLDELWSDFESAKGDNRKLQKLHEKISKLRFLDPACGCGNFLIMAYRELRLLEMEILKQQLKGQTVTDITTFFTIDVDNFYGIEYEEFPAQIAQVAMWLIDHQMNMKASETFGEYYVRLPLKKSATVIQGNALRMDWQSLLTEKSKYNYIMGNPPFIGHQWRSPDQMEDMEVVFGDAKKAGRLDYVTAWYLKAAQYMQNHNVSDNDSKTIPAMIRTGFVSTNSISQGEQVGILWSELFSKYHIKIHFAHRTFSWSNEARGNAAVHVVIIGFANFDSTNKLLYDYEHLKSEPHVIPVKNINPYLVEGKDVFLQSRTKPIHGFPEMFKGSQPTDGGHLIMTSEEMKEMIKNEQQAEKWIRPYIGGFELMNGIIRHCLWLKDCPPDELRKMPLVLKRLDEVRKARSLSPTRSVREFSKFPHLFTQDRQPSTNYLALPRVSSESRYYIPLAYLTPHTIAHEMLNIIPEASYYLFGILMSAMHMAWTKTVCGRLKSDYRYSPAIYNSFPFPKDINDKLKESVEKAAQAVLDSRAQFLNASLADLYAPNTMPPTLVKAHQALDKAVDLCYRPQPFPTETKRIEYLFELYDQYTAGMFQKEKKKPKQKVQ
jgi:hypothetical protein